MRRWVVASCRAALATAGARDAHDDVSFAMPQPPSEAATTAMAAARDALDVFSTWADGAPHVELARALELSPLATRILVLVAAPQIWGELARAYGRCTADPARPLVDELLLAHLLHADSRQRAALGRELDEDAPLIRTGAVVLARGLRPYAAVAVHPAIARRLAGAPPAGDIEHAPTPLPLADIVAPPGALEALARDLASAAPHRCRVVLRGRAGAGRRTIAAALAATVGRQIGAVPASSTDADVVRARLREVALRGDIPCVTLERGIDDPAAQAKLRAVLDDHVGPLFIRAPHTGELPLAAGYLALELPPLTETARCDAWRTALSRHGHDATFASALALRFAATPGTMHRVCASVASCESVDVLSHALRQHRSSTIEACAARVERLPTWDQLVVPAEVEDALREVLARARHRRIVLDEWGMDRVAATARGITALFQGGPGTGKTLAAGAIARALGFELWRVDLSKVASKWIGETEKNLSTVFDAAEDGDVVLLFDEADSLFGRRTEVRTSQDRSANAETNYLLQRLDAFTGIAILTTNFGTAIDPAFRRRLSVHVQFPFPDETDRVRLWRAHVPATLPTAGDLELGALARRFELSGGYIRNAALRAAYLAAADGSPLSSDHLRRAVALEYQRAGKIGEGRLE
ncbi:MAG: ATP-binding protein [Kofleriaceae bacterium]|nr:ATP-binding protein [Kofleriaceae bacterium]